MGAGMYFRNAFKLYQPWLYMLYSLSDVCLP